MKQYLVAGHILFHTPGQSLPIKGIAVLADHEVMDLPTLAKVEAILLHEHNTLSKMAVAKAVQITSFQPFETQAVAQPAAEPHLNECSVVLPPVDSPLLIEIAPGVLLPAKRDEHAESRNDLLRFRLEHGGFFTGRPRWTHA